MDLAITFFYLAIVLELWGIERALLMIVQVLRQLEKKPLVFKGE